MNQTEEYETWKIEVLSTHNNYELKNKKNILTITSR